MKMSDLTLEATHNGIYLDSTLTGVHVGRQGINGEEDPLNNVTITAGSGNAIYVKTGDWAVGTPDFDDEDYIDDPNGRGSVSILAKNTKLVSTNDSAIHIEGKWNSNVRQVINMKATIPSWMSTLTTSLSSTGISRLIRLKVLVARLHQYQRRR